MVTIIVDRNGYNLGMQYHRALWKNSVVSEIMPYNDNIMNEYGLSDLPAAITGDGQIINKDQMERYVLQSGAVSSVNMI